jgi:hypothetical protein
VVRLLFLLAMVIERLYRIRYLHRSTHRLGSYRPTCCAACFG